MGLRHRLRLRPGTAIAPGGGHSLYSCICPSNRPFGGELFNVFCMPGWIFRRRELRLRLRLPSVPGHACPLTGGAYALRLVVFGRDAGPLMGRRQHRLQHQERVILATKLSSRAEQTSVLALRLLLCLGMGRAQSAIAITPQQRLRSSGGYASEEPGTVATAARRIVATSEGGGRPSRQSRPEQHWFFNTFTQHKQFATISTRSCCPWRWSAQVTASQRC